MADGTANRWKALEERANASRQKLWDDTEKGVTEWPGWRLLRCDSAGRWHAEGPSRKRVHADTGPELVKKVRAANGAAHAKAPQLGLFDAPATPRAEELLTVDAADLVPDEPPSVRRMGTHRTLGVEVRMGLATDWGRR